MTNQSKYLNKKIYVAGHTGMVGSAITREFQKRGFNNLILKNYTELDLKRQDDVEKFFKEVLAEVENEAGALEEARDFYGRLFDQDGDGKPDFSDPDRNGDGITDAPEVQ